jgi:hypothetical protein
VSRPSLDFTDPEAVSQWLRALTEAWRDADAVSVDMLRRPRDRELGPVLHAEKYHEARAQLLQALAYAGPGPEPEGPKSSDRPGRSEP